MKSLLVLLVMVGTASAEKWPVSGPCEDVETCKAACAKNKKGTCYFAGVLVMQTAEEGRYESAHKLFEQSCKRGDAEACFQAAKLVAHFEYEAEKKSGPKALAAYKRACDKNHARACDSYAYYLGEGDEKSKKLATAIRVKSVALMAKRCRKENMVEACNRASWSYEEGGDGVPKSPKQAAELLAHLCKLDPKHYRCEKR